MRALHPRAWRTCSACGKMMWTTKPFMRYHTKRHNAWIRRAEISVDATEFFRCGLDGYPPWLRKPSRTEGT